MKPVKDEAYYREFIQARVKADENGCWIWQGFSPAPPNDYGYVFAYGRRWRAHRLAYKLWKGDPDPALDVCHTCDVKRCCNPDHLWQGTAKQNMRDAAAKQIWSRQRRNHCKHGHEYTPENTAIRVKPDGRTCRLCKQCMKEAVRRDRASGKAEARRRRRRAALKQANRLSFQL